VQPYYRESGKGETLVILHGLYGSSDNWVSISKELDPFFRVINIDQRNHGQSPHSPEISYSSLSDDLLELFDALKLEKAILLGHSMGGKTAMLFTIEHPEKVSSLIVVDIAPWSHLSNNELSDKIVSEHRHIINGLMSIPIENLTSRNQADAILSEWVKPEYIRQFLLKNLKREQNGSFKWKLNLSAIASNIVNLMSEIEPKSQNKSCNTKTLFIKGELSNYIPNNKEVDLKTIFTNSEIVTIENSGHWVHAEKPKEFVNAVLAFLLKKNE
jgi:esterase